MQQWYVRVRGTPRKEVDTQLLTQALVALGKQLDRAAVKAETPSTTTKPREEEA